MALGTCEGTEPERVAIAAGSLALSISMAVTDTSGRPQGRSSVEMIQCVRGIEPKERSGRETEMLLQARSLVSYLYVCKMRSLVPNEESGYARVNTSHNTATDKVKRGVPTY